ncbi:MAG: class I tRNA ligase family protein [Candidatus Atabeyarchaeum deiterrae]
MITISKPEFGEKHWSVKTEEEILQKWRSKKSYSFDLKNGKQPFSIDTPPPYASGRWHLGGAVHYSQIDMIARCKRMEGYEVLFPMGIDRNG